MPDLTNEEIAAMRALFADGTPFARLLNEHAALKAERAVLLPIARRAAWHTRDVGPEPKMTLADAVDGWLAFERERSYVVDLDKTLADLATIVLNEHGTPDRKLPGCPRCDEDELWGRAVAGGNSFSCYRCGWEYTVAT